MQLERAVPPLRCSDRSRVGGEPLTGTAPESGAWLLVEQEPPWGSEALLESGIDGTVARELARRAGEAGVKVLLIRRRGAPRGGAARRVVAAAVGTTSFVQELVVPRDEQLLDLDLRRLGRGETFDGGTDVDGSLTLVCTNGRRDACCALLGRRAADALAAARPEQTSESSHIGGHRFAPTILSFPTGACFGRLEPAGAVAAIAALEQGVLDLEHLRGIVGRPAPVQVGESALRMRHGLTRVDELRLLGWRRIEGAVEATFAGAEDREHRVLVRSRPAPLRTLSCGAEPQAEVRWEPVDAS